jgi:hypothetical protein
MAARKPFLLRIDSQLWDELERWARDELRSVNGQIEYVLRQAVLKRKASHTEQGVADHIDEDRSASENEPGTAQSSQ